MKQLSIFIFLLTSFTASAQSSCPIKRAYAFYTVNMPGMIRVDDEGNQVRPDPMIERVIYIECYTPGLVVPDSALYGNVYVKFKIERIKGQHVNVGKKTTDGKYFTFTARKGYYLWKLQMETMGEKSGAALNCRNIVLKARAAGKTCTFKLNLETELEGIPRY